MLSVISAAGVLALLNHIDVPLGRLIIISFLVARTLPVRELFAM